MHLREVDAPPAGAAPVRVLDAAFVACQSVCWTLASNELESLPDAATGAALGCWLSMSPAAYLFHSARTEAGGSAGSDEPASPLKNSMAVFPVDGSADMCLRSYMLSLRRT